MTIATKTMWVAIRCKHGKIYWAKHSQFQPYEIFMGILLWFLANSVYYLNIVNIHMKIFCSILKTAKIVKFSPVNLSVLTVLSTCTCTSFSSCTLWYYGPKWVSGAHICLQHMLICDWIWDRAPSTHYKYLKIPILIIWSSITQQGK